LSILWWNDEKDDGFIGGDKKKRYYKMSRGIVKVKTSKGHLLDSYIYEYDNYDDVLNKRYQIHKMY